MFGGLGIAEILALGMMFGFFLLVAVLVVSVSLYIATRVFPRVLEAQRRSGAAN